MAKRGPKPTKRPIGAPLKLTPEIIGRIVQALRAGSYVETAAAHAGIHKDTYYRWMREGAAEREHISSGRKPRKSKALFLDLSDAVERAMADAELRDLALVSQASVEDWRAAAWKLERRNPGRWGRTRQEITGADGGPIAVQTWAELVESARKEEEDK
jgi:transposase